MTMTQEKQKVEPFISIPRYIVDDLRDGEINHRQYEVYIWVRLQANPYGIATVSTESILADLSHLKTTDWVSKILRSLRHPRYLYYKERQGHRGSFRVYFGHWKLPNGEIRTIDKMFTDEELRSLLDSKDFNKSEDDSMTSPSTPKSESAEDPTRQDNFASKHIPELRSPYNEYDTQKVNKTYESLEKKPFKGIVTQSFVPSNDNEERCWKIALELGDPFMDYILKKLREHGIETINDSWQTYCQIRTENERAGKPTRNPAALFNWCVQQIIEDEQILKEERERYGDDSIGRE